MTSQHTAPTFVAAVAFAAASASAQLELTTNGDFETGDGSGWLYLPTGSSSFSVTSDAKTDSFGGSLDNFGEAHRDRLAGRIAGVLGQAREEVQMRQLCHFFQADPDYGRRVAEKLGVDVEAMMAAGSAGA